MELRAVAGSDRAPLHDLLREIPSFSEAEVEVALELIDGAIHDPAGSGYHAIVALVDGKVGGYVCFGPTPMTERTYDLYWIAVAPGLEGRGVGRALYAALEARIADSGGGRVRIETSSTEAYDRTSRFYEQLGFSLVSRLSDFYTAGDDLLVYYKRVTPCAST